MFHLLSVVNSSSQSKCCNYNVSTKPHSCKVYDKPSLDNVGWGGGGNTSDHNKYVSEIGRYVR